MAIAWTGVMRLKPVSEMNLVWGGGTHRDRDPETMSKLAVAAFDDCFSG